MKWLKHNKTLWLSSGVELRLKTRDGIITIRDNEKEQKVEVSK